MATTFLVPKNNAYSTLASGIDDVALSLVVAAGEGARFPSTYPFHITIDSEILECTNRAVDTLTVTRSAESTSAASHNAGATVRLNITAEALSDLNTAVNAIENGSMLDNTAGGTDGEITKAPTSNAFYDVAINVRTKLTANRTYYVRTDGNDSNTGLADSAGGAFLTIQKAIDTTASLDCSLYDITIQLGAGTYTLTATISLKNIVGAGAVTIIGDETTPTNVVLDFQSSSNGFSANGIYTVYKLKGFKIYSSTSTATYLIHAHRSPAKIELQNLNIGAGAVQPIRSADGGGISITGNYTISGGATANHWTGVAGLFRCQFVTITLTGTPAFGNCFVAADYGSVFIVNVITFSGSATGARYSVSANGVLYTGGGGADYFPGDSAGASATGGQYV